MMLCYVHALVQFAVKLRPSFVSLCFLTLLVSACDGGSSGDPAPDVQTSESNPASEVSPFPPIPTRTAALADVPSNELFYTLATNSELLSGPIIGNGQLDNIAVTRSLPFIVSNIDAGLIVEHVTLGFNSVNATSRIISVVRSTAASDYCGLSSGLVTALDANGFPITSTDAATGTASPIAKQGKVLGTIRKHTQEIVGSFYYDDCITPGSLAYLVTELPVSNDNIDGVSIANLNNEDLVYSLTDIDASPVMYELGTVNDTTFSLTVKSNSTNTINLLTATVILLDADGFPLNYIETEEIGTIEPGGETNTVIDAAGFNGSSSIIRVVFSIDSLYDW